MFVTMDSKEKKESDSSQVHSFDEAITIAGNGKFQTILLFIFGICLMSVIIETSVVGFYATVARCDLGFTLSQQGILTSAAYFGMVLMSYPWGYMSDTFGRRKIIQISTMGGFVASIISTFSNSVWMLIILRFIVGCFIAGTQVSVFSYLGEFHSTATRTKAVTLLSSFVTIGLAVPPALAIGILPLQITGEMYGKPFSPWRILGIAAASPTLIITFILPFIPESPKFLLAAGKPEKALEVLRLTFSFNKGLPKSMYTVLKLAAESDSIKSKNQGFIGNLKQIYSNTIRMFERTRLLTSLNLLFQLFGIYLVSHGLYMWFPSILSWMVKHSDEHLSIYEITQILIKQKKNGTQNYHRNMCNTTKKSYIYETLAIMGILYTIVYLVIGFLINRIGKSKLLGVYLLFSGMAGVALYWAKGFYLCLILFVIFIGTGDAGGIVCTMVVDYYPTQINALAMCLIMLLGRFGVVLGSNIYGYIIATNINLLFTALGGLIILLSALSIFLPKEENKEENGN